MPSSIVFWYNRFANMQDHYSQKGSEIHPCLGINNLDLQLTDNV